MGAEVINCSWGCSVDENLLLESAIDESDALFVCASGNEGKDIDMSPVYPASYDSPNIITVAALDRNGMLPSYSNYGIDSVDVAAPSDEIISTLPETPMH